MDIFIKLNGRFGFDADCFGFGFDAVRFAFDAPVFFKFNGFFFLKYYAVAP